MILFFLSVLIVFLLAVNILGAVLSGPRYSGPLSDHFNGLRFVNTDGARAKGPLEVFKWLITRKRSPWKNDQNIPFGPKPDMHVHEGVKITIINHSTFLIQLNGLNILTDPIWSERASPFSFIGPKRMRRPGIDLKDLPPIDVILLSHNHYDHLDLPTLKKILTTHQPKIFTPLGVKIFLEKKGIVVAQDMDWWDEHELSKQLKIICIPAQHFSGRGTSDRDGTLWCGYLIMRPEGNIYFAGDTGYSNRIFKDVGDRFAPIRVSLLPVGAYKPEWFMSPIHCSPEDAVQLHLDLKSQISIAAHYGTFPLADEEQYEPLRDLKTACVKKQVPSDDFIALHEGEGKLFF